MSFLAWLLDWPRAVTDVDSKRDVFVSRLQNKGVPKVHESVLGGCMLSIYLWTRAQLSSCFLAECSALLWCFCYLKKVRVLALDTISFLFEESCYKSNHWYHPIYADYFDLYGCFLLWTKNPSCCFHMHRCCCCHSNCILGYCRE